MVVGRPLHATKLQEWRLPTAPAPASRRLPSGWRLLGRLQEPIRRGFRLYHPPCRRRDPALLPLALGGRATRPNLRRGGRSPIRQHHDGPQLRAFREARRAVRRQLRQAGCRRQRRHQSFPANAARCWRCKRTLSSFSGTFMTTRLPKRLPSRFWTNTRNLLGWRTVCDGARCLQVGQAWRGTSGRCSTSTPKAATRRAPRRSCSSSRNSQD
mmetsp:Transcript_57812/g.161351  ORF Transcript_57812/g.161351 Transcript_57812/m.161351 type:complete len:212 (+) Transcript_57812:505-1140(+)